MIGFSYAQLKTALQDWPSETKPEYVTNLDRIIYLGELRLIKDLNLDIFDKIDATPAVTIGNRDVTKPVDLITDRSLWFVASGVYSRLYKRSYDYIRSYAASAAISGTPKYYADKNDTTWSLAPYPIATGTVEVHYVGRPASIVTAGNTWLGDKAGDLLFVCCLMESEQFLKADDRYADMKAKYATELLPVARVELRNQIRKGDRTPLQSVSTVSG